MSYNMHLHNHYISLYIERYSNISATAYRYTFYSTSRLTKHVKNATWPERCSHQKERTRKRENENSQRFGVFVLSRFHVSVLSILVFSFLSFRVFVCSSFRVFLFRTKMYVTCIQTHEVSNT